MLSTLWLKRANTSRQEAGQMEMYKYNRGESWGQTPWQLSVPLESPRWEHVWRSMAFFWANGFLIANLWIAQRLCASQRGILVVIHFQWCAYFLRPLHTCQHEMVFIKPGDDRNTQTFQTHWKVQFLCPQFLLPPFLFLCSFNPAVALIVPWKHGREERTRGEREQSERTWLGILRSFTSVELE